MLEKIDQAVDFLLSHTAPRPEIGMITGTGLGGLTGALAVESRMPYEEIPHFPRSTVEGHGGRLVFGRVEEKPVVVMEGRFHLYEGYSPREVAFPVFAMARMGIRHLLISSAVGGLNPQFHQGDLMVVTDHINLTGTSPLVGPNPDALGPRFPDMSRVYDRHLVRLAADTALQCRIRLRQGVYAGVLGPNLETPAETRFLKMIGADAVGMSTVAEAIAAKHCGLMTLAIMVVTNMNLPDCMEETSIADVITASGAAAPVLAGLWKAIIRAM